MTMNAGAANGQVPRGSNLGFVQGSMQEIQNEQAQMTVLTMKHQSFMKAQHLVQQMAKELRT